MGNLEKIKIDTCKIKLAAIAVHCEELFTLDGRGIDKDTIKSLLSDPEVRKFLDDPNNKVFLPLKRRTNLKIIL